MTFARVRRERSLSILALLHIAGNGKAYEKPDDYASYDKNRHGKTRLRGRSRYGVAKARALKPARSSML